MKNLIIFAGVLAMVSCGTSEVVDEKEITITDTTEVNEPVEIDSVSQIIDSLSVMSSDTTLVQ